MLAKNFKVFEDLQKRRITIIATIVFFIFLILSGMIPLLDKIPSVVYTIAYAIAINTTINKFQRKKLMIILIREVFIIQQETVLSL